MTNTQIGPLTAQGNFLSSADTAPNYAAGASFFSALSWMAVGMQAIGGFYAAKAQKEELKSKASALRFRASMSQLNARAAEEQAQSILAAGQRAAGRVTLRAGQIKGAQRARLAARGIAGGGSAAAELATTDLIKEIDVLTINQNTVAQAGAARQQGVNFLNQAGIDRASAANTRASARTISPLMAGGTTLLGGAARVGSRFDTDTLIRRLRTA